MTTLPYRIAVVFAAGAMIAIPLGLSTALGSGVFGLLVGSFFLIRDRDIADAGFRKAIIASVISSGVLCFGAFYNNYRNSLDKIQSVGSIELVRWLG